MPFVSAKCTCCGAEITVDDTKEALICEHCNSAFIVEKAIELYNAGQKTVEFEIYDGVLKKYNGSSEDVIIPDNVRRIGGGAFAKHNELKSVIIPDSVTEIGDYAFAYCESLSKITCPGYEDQINRVIFSPYLTYFGDHCFRGCFSLPAEIIFLNKGRIYHDGEPVFRHCYDEAENVTVIQRGHSKPRMFSKVGSFDMELAPLANYLFGLDFDKNRIRYVDGRDGSDKDKPEDEERRSHHSHPSDGEHRVHRSDFWRQNGLCAHCGGTFNVFKKCRTCGKKKDY